MRIAVGSDERTNLTDFVVADLKRRGHEVICFGPITGNQLPWPQVGETVATQVQSGACQEGIVLCWTGTGVCIAANKVAGIRAALCSDPYTASGARKWNRANVLALSLRSTSEAVAKEILDEWFLPQTPQEEDMNHIAYLEEMETKYLHR